MATAYSRRQARGQRYDQAVTDLGPSMLIALSCLVLHWSTITSLVDDFGTLPERNP